MCQRYGKNSTQRSLIGSYYFPRKFIQGDKNKCLAKMVFQEHLSLNCYRKVTVLNKVLSLSIYNICMQTIRIHGPKLLMPIRIVIDLNNQNFLVTSEGWHENYSLIGLLFNTKYQSSGVGNQPKSIWLVQDCQVLCKYWSSLVFTARWDVTLTAGLG